MKTIVILFAGLGLGTSALAQTGLPLNVPPPVVTAPAPAITAPVQTATVQPKPPRRIQRDETRPARKPAVENNTPAPRQNNTPVPRQNRRNSQAQSRPQPAPVNTVSYADALKRQHHDRHDHLWWTTHYRVIVVVNNVGYYYLDSGYWFPAYGYAPDYENFDEDGPIFTYSNLLPDQVIYNVQRALKELGYYEGPLTGSFSAATRVAIRAFQADNGLDASGRIDAPTVEALGLS